MSNRLAEKIQRARLSAQLTQAQVAERLGLTRGAVTQWESKNPESRTTPSIELLRQLAEIVGVPMEWLLDEKTRPDDVHFARARYLAAARMGKPLHYRTDDNRSLMNPELFKPNRSTEASVPDEMRDEELRKMVNAEAHGAATPEQMTILEDLGGAQAVRMRLDLESDRPARMAMNFWNAVEFEVCSMRPELEAAFSAVIPHPSFTTRPDFLHGNVLAEFSYTLNRRTLQILIRRKIGDLLIAEQMLRHPLRKYLLFWWPAQLENDGDLEEAQQFGEALDISIQAFQQPQQAARFLLSIV